MAASFVDRLVIGYDKSYLFPFIVRKHSSHNTRFNYGHTGSKICCHKEIFSQEDLCSKKVEKEVTELHSTQEETGARPPSPTSQHQRAAVYFSLHRTLHFAMVTHSKLHGTRSLRPFLARKGLHHNQNHDAAFHKRGQFVLGTQHPCTL